jgi:hypothetical protein
MVAMPEPGTLVVHDGAKVGHVQFSSIDTIRTQFSSCWNGPGKQVRLQVEDDKVFSYISEGTFKNGKLEGPGMRTIGAIGGAGQGGPQGAVRVKGMFKDGELEGPGTIDGRKVFFKGYDIVECLSPGFFRKYFSGSKTKLLEHYMAITGGPPPVGGRFIKQMRRALIDEHYSAEQLRTLGDRFSLHHVVGWRDNASADLAGLRTMLKSSECIAALL